MISIYEDKSISIVNALQQEFETKWYPSIDLVIFDGNISVPDQNLLAIVNLPTVYVWLDF